MSELDDTYFFDPADVSLLDLVELDDDLTPALIADLVADFADEDINNSDEEPPTLFEDPLTLETWAEIGRSFQGVNMKTMPHVPSTAPCREPDADPEDWFHPFRKMYFYGFTPDEAAEDLCHECPVLHECLTWALDNPKQDGILGGTTAQRRKRMRRT